MFGNGEHNRRHACRDEWCREAAKRRWHGRGRPWSAAWRVSLNVDSEMGKPEPAHYPVRFSHRAAGGCLTHSIRPSRSAEDYLWLMGEGSWVDAAALERVVRSVDDLASVGAKRSAEVLPLTLTSVSAQYGCDASRHERTAWLLVLVGVATACALVITPLTILNDVDDDNVIAVICAAGAVAAFLAVAVAASMAAKRQWLLASEARRMERQLSALDPFIGTARSRSELAFRMSISHRLFPRVLGDADPLRESAPLSPEDIADLLSIDSHDQDDED